MKKNKKCKKISCSNCSSYWNGTCLLRNAKTSKRFICMEYINY